MDKSLLLRLAVLVGILATGQLVAINVPEGQPRFITGGGMVAQVRRTCMDCGYVASNPHTFKGHIYDRHTRKMNGLAMCTYRGCGAEFQSDRELMWHIDTGRHNAGTLSKNEKKKCGCRGRKRKRSRA